MLPVLVPLAYTQGIFYFVLGLWPVVHMASFLFVTGHKVDTWLVKTVGLLIAIIGLVLLIAARRKELTVETFILGLLSAVCLGCIDIYYVAQHRIRRVYLLDAVIEFIFAALWARGLI